MSAHYAIPRPGPTPVPDPVSSHPDITPVVDAPAVPDGVYQLTDGALGRKGRQVRVRTVRIVEMRDLHGDWSVLPERSADRLVCRIGEGRAAWVGSA